MTVIFSYHISPVALFDDHLTTDSVAHDSLACWQQVISCEISMLQRTYQEGSYQLTVVQCMSLLSDREVVWTGANGRLIPHLVVPAVHSARRAALVENTRTPLRSPAAMVPGAWSGRGLLDDGTGL